jgi:hypothetical protein
MFTQHVVDCRDHEDCTAIVCTKDDGSEVWTSHSPKDHAPDERINPDVPALDKRGQKDIKAKGKPLTPKSAKP